jgi:sarcosine oxidase, subunit beta
MNATTTVVIGGGVIGLSAAYQLAEKGAGRVVLLDKGLPGDGSSIRAAGIGIHLLWSEAAVRARKTSFRLFQQFSDEWNDYTFHNERGCLNLITQSAWSGRESLLPLYDRLDVPYEVLDAKEIHYRWPTITPPPDCVGLFDPNGGYSEPDEYLSALAKRVRSYGVEVFENEPVVEFLRCGDGVVGVRTPRQTIHADSVVSTVHVWSLPVWRELGLRLPMKHFVHQRYLTTPAERPFAAPPVNADLYGGYLRPAVDNRLLMGVETADREEYRVESREFHMQDLSTPIVVRNRGHARLMRLAPQLECATWESEKIGLISFSSDGEPVLGSVSERAGLFVAASFHSGGFSYSAVAGLLLAELVVDGRTSIDITSFSPDRFVPADTERYLATTIHQRQVAWRRH